MPTCAAAAAEAALAAASAAAAETDDDEAADDGAADDDDEEEEDAVLLEGGGVRGEEIPCSSFGIIAMAIRILELSLEPPVLIRVFKPMPYTSRNSELPERS